MSRDMIPKFSVIAKTCKNHGSSVRNSFIGSTLRIQFNILALKIFPYKATCFFSVTIERRGNTGGHLRHDITEDFDTLEKMRARLAVSLAGKLGEEVADGENKHTTGCSSDYQHAQMVAKSFVTSNGFADTLYNTATNGYNRSADYQKTVDQEVKKLLDEANSKAKEILKKNADRHKRLAEALLVKKTLTADEIKAILK